MKGTDMKDNYQDPWDDQEEQDSGSFFTDTASSRKKKSLFDGLFDDPIKTAEFFMLNDALDEDDRNSSHNC